MKIDKRRFNYPRRYRLVVCNDGDQPSSMDRWCQQATGSTRSTHMPKPGPEELVVKNSAVAINPVDWKMQDGFYLDQLKLPFILGTDVAGVVHEVGTAVKDFNKGDRVLA